MVRRHLGLEDWVSGWSGSYGGPLWDGAPEVVEDLALAFRRTDSLRRRRSEIVWAGAERPAGPWKGWEPLKTAVLPLDGQASFDDFLRGTFPKNRRNECTRSEKRGLRVVHDPEGEYLIPVWELYSQRCQQWRSPVVPCELLEEFVSEWEEVSLFVALHEAEGVVGGHVCVRSGTELFAWLGTTRRMERVYPSALLIREEARWVHENALLRLNLGSSMGIGGVQNYKQLLGATEETRWILRDRAWWWPRRR